MKEIVNLLPHLPIIFICNIFYNLCYAKLTNHSLNYNFKNFLIIFLSTICVFLNNFFNIVAVKILINFFILIIELKVVFKDNLKKVIVNYVIIYILTIAIEMISTIILRYCNLLINNETSGNITIITSILTIINSVLEFLIIKIPFINKLLQNFANFFVKNQSISNLIYIIFITTAILAMLNIENFANKESVLLLISLVILFTTLFVIIIRLEFNTVILKMNNKKLIDYNNNYGKFLDEYKIYKHNMNHKLAAIKDYGNKKVNSLINAILDEENDFALRNNEFYKLPNGIKGIITEKLYNKNYEIVIDNKIQKDPFNSLSPKNFNSISECIGNAIDNAIEAAEETPTPFILIELFETNNKISIKIGNPFCNFIDIEKLGDKKYSTKKRESGYGLFSIKRNKFVKEKINIENNIFFIELSLYKK